MRSRWLLLSSVVFLVLALGVQLGHGVGQAQAPEADLVVTKGVDPAVIAPDEYVVYTVTLDNTSGAGLSVSSLTDTLPAEFEFVTMVPGSQVGEDPVCAPPVCVWTGPIEIPAGESLTLMYRVYVPGSVPLDPEPYINTVTASVGPDQYTAQAGLLVAQGEVSLSKTAAPNRVEPGGVVVYSVTLSNGGYVPVPLDTVTDILPDGVTFLAMTPGSDIQVPPNGTTGEIAWQGPFEIPAAGDLLVQYKAEMPQAEGTLYLYNEVTALLGDGTLLGPASAEVVVSTGGVVYVPLMMSYWSPPVFSVTKAAEPSVVYAQVPGGLITYTVVFSNEGTAPGELAEVRDTLPAGFTYQRMLPGSDIPADPVGTTGQIAWTGPFTVDGEGALTLIYEVRASTEIGTYVNSVTATASVGEPPKQPASATVKVQAAVLLDDDFNSGTDLWTPFLNNSRLSPLQWWWQSWGGYQDSGNYLYSMWGDPNKEAHDSLTMALVPGSENWTDYRYELLVFLEPSSLWTTQFALWFRGNYQESDVPNQWVLGYYFNLYPKSNKVSFWQSQTPDDCIEDTCWTPAWQYNYSNPMLLHEAPWSGGDDFFGAWHHVAVEVRGYQMTGYIDGVQVIQFTDTEGTLIPTGTVGMSTYKTPLIHFENVLVTPLD